MPNVCDICVMMFVALYNFKFCSELLELLLSLLFSAILMSILYDICKKMMACLIQTYVHATAIFNI